MTGATGISGTGSACRDRLVPPEDIVEVNLPWLRPDAVSALLQPSLDRLDMLAFRPVLVEVGDVSERLTTPAAVTLLCPYPRHAL